MAAFQSWKEFREFAAFVKRISRYILDERRQRFLEILHATSAKRKIVLKAGQNLWRAQLGNDYREEIIRGPEEEALDSWQTQCPFHQERMFPLKDRAIEGRVNPKGIPCLYLSTDRDTAMSEVRPWIDSYISVAELVVTNDLNLVDCSADGEHPGSHYLAEPDSGVREQYVWWSVNQAFAEPVTRADDVADYVPTQIIAEAFRAEGLDGIQYRSKLGRGRTVALFDMDKGIKITSVFLHQVERVEFTFSSAKDGYGIGG